LDERDGATEALAIGETDANIYRWIRDTLAQARAKAYSAINFSMVEAYRDIGRQIEEAVGERAEYGKDLLKFLAKTLTGAFGKGFTERNLQAMRQFYRAFPTHYRLLMKISDASRRAFYARECAEAAWSVRRLERQINSFF
jgi:hypothetical protein